MHQNKMKLKWNNYVVEDGNLKQRNYISQINESLIVIVSGWGKCFGLFD